MKSGRIGIVKLVAIILAGFLLVFLVFGAKQLTPLYNRMGDMFDNVLYFFDLKDDGSVRGDCVPVRILDWGSEGLTFLNDVGVSEGERESVDFIICDDGTCGVGPISGREYRIFEGKFEYSSEGEDWFSQEDYLFEWSRSTEDTKEDWEVYHGFLDLMEAEFGEDLLGNEEFKKIYDERVTKSFWLYGNGEGLGDAYYTYWESGVWYFWKEKTPEFLTSSGFMTVDSTVSDFYNVVSGGGKWYVNKDEVYYTEKLPKLKDGKYFEEVGTPEEIFDKKKKYLDKQLSKGEITQEQYNQDIRDGWKPINFLIGGKNYEVNNDDERDILIEEVKNIIGQLAGSTKISDEKLVKLENAINGKEIVVGDFIYVMNLKIDSKGYPKIIFIHGNQEYELRFDNHVEIFRKEIPLRHYPLKLFYDKTTPLDEGDYKLPKAEFDEFYKLNLIEDFIREKCR